MNKVARTSEFWVGLVAAVGQFLAAQGVIPQASWDHFIYPMIVYVLSRVLSKGVKAGIKPKE